MEKIPAMHEFGKRLDGPGGRRRTGREPVQLPASVTTMQTSLSVVMINVSRTGAKLRLAEPIRVGEDVWIKVPPIDCLAAVVWSGPELCGIRFDERLSEVEVAHLQRESHWTMVTQLTPEEKLAAEDWASGLAR